MNYQRLYYAFALGVALMLLGSGYAMANDDRSRGISKREILARLNVLETDLATTRAALSAAVLRLCGWAGGVVR